VIPWPRLRQAFFFAAEEVEIGFEGEAAGITGG
jgi:hypothetical protein